MKECNLCGMHEHRMTSYKVRTEDGTIQSYPALECLSCGCVEPDDESIDWAHEVPEGLKERCDEVRSESRIRIEMRKSEDEARRYAVA